MLQVQVLEYRHVGAGVEVDICISATARTGCPVWESILTLLSKFKLHKDTRCFPMNENKSGQQSDQPDEPVPETMKQVEVRVPWSSGLQYLWSPCDCSPYGLISLPARLFGYRSHTTPSLWMLSVCLAEIEKHKGVEVITAPVSITAQFKEPLLVPGKATITFWEKIKDEGQSSFQGLNFRMQQHGSKICHLGEERGCDKSLVSRHPDRERNQFSAAVLEIRGTCTGLFHLYHVIFFTGTSGGLKQRKTHGEAKKQRHCQHPSLLSDREHRCGGLP
ncbi:uncharacterized protein LOC113138458 isoform X3 [Mastacembelus armatus]|nr:uncharacterized protein LOC113138458 isoform X3 [Mastacembelus armatus]